MSHRAFPPQLMAQSPWVYGRLASQAAWLR
ncbi:hypothetical protein DERA104750_07880 [Deinococcus radiodurans]